MDARAPTALAWRDVILAGVAHAYTVPQGSSSAARHSGTSGSLVVFEARHLASFLLACGRASSLPDAELLGEALRARDVIRPHVPPHVLASAAHPGAATQAVERRFVADVSEWVCRGGEDPTSSNSFSVAALLASSACVFASVWAKQGTFFLNSRYIVLDRTHRQLYVFTHDYSLAPRYYIDFRSKAYTVALILPHDMQSHAQGIVASRPRGGGGGAAAGDAADDMASSDTDTDDASARLQSFAEYGDVHVDAAAATTASMTASSLPSSGILAALFGGGRASSAPDIHAQGHARGRTRAATSTGVSAASADADASIAGVTARGSPGFCVSGPNFKLTAYTHSVKRVLVWVHALRLCAGQIKSASSGRARRTMSHTQLRLRMLNISLPMTHGALAHPLPSPPALVDEDSLSSGTVSRTASVSSHVDSIAYTDAMSRKGAHSRHGSAPTTTLPPPRSTSTSARVHVHTSAVAVERARYGGMRSGTPSSGSLPMDSPTVDEGEPGGDGDACGDGDAADMIVPAPSGVSVAPASSALVAPLPSTALITNARALLSVPDVAIGSSSNVDAALMCEMYATVLDTYVAVVCGGDMTHLRAWLTAPECVLTHTGVFIHTHQSYILDRIAACIPPAANTAGTGESMVPHTHSSMNTNDTVDSEVELGGAGTGESRGASDAFFPPSAPSQLPAVSADDSRAWFHSERMLVQLQVQGALGAYTHTLQKCEDAAALTAQLELAHTRTPASVGDGTRELYTRGSNVSSPSPTSGSVRATTSASAASAAAAALAASLSVDVSTHTCEAWAVTLARVCATLHAAFKSSSRTQSQMDAATSDATAIAATATTAVPSRSDSTQSTDRGRGASFLRVLFGAPSTTATITRSGSGTDLDTALNAWMGTQPHTRAGRSGSSEAYSYGGAHIHAESPRTTVAAHAPSRASATGAHTPSPAVNARVMDSVTSRFKTLLVDHCVSILTAGVHPLSLTLQRVCAGLAALYTPACASANGLEPRHILDCMRADMSGALARVCTAAREWPRVWMHTLNDWGGTSQYLAPSPAFTEAFTDGGDDDALPGTAPLFRKWYRMSTATQLARTAPSRAPASAAPRGHQAATARAHDASPPDAAVLAAWQYVCKLSHRLTLSDRDMNEVVRDAVHRVAFGVFTRIISALYAHLHTAEDTELRHATQILWGITPAQLGLPRELQVDVCAAVSPCVDARALAAMYTCVAIPLRLPLPLIPHTTLARMQHVHTQAAMTSAAHSRMDAHAAIAALAPASRRRTMSSAPRAHAHTHAAVGGLTVMHAHASAGVARTQRRHSVTVPRPSPQESDESSTHESEAEAPPRLLPRVRTNPRMPAPQPSTSGSDSERDAPAAPHAAAAPPPLRAPPSASMPTHSSDTSFVSYPSYGTGTREHPAAFAAFQPAIDVLALLPAYAEPHMKLRVLATCVDILCRCLTLHRQGMATALEEIGAPVPPQLLDPAHINADDLLGLLCLIALHAHVPNLFAEVDFMYEWASEEALIEQTGFFLTSLQAACMYAVSEDPRARIQCGHCTGTSGMPVSVRCRACGRQLCAQCDGLVHTHVLNESIASAMQKRSAANVAVPLSVSARRAAMESALSSVEARHVREVAPISLFRTHVRHDAAGRSSGTRQGASRTIRRAMHGYAQVKDTQDTPHGSDEGEDGSDEGGVPRQARAIVYGSATPAPARSHAPVRTPHAAMRDRDRSMSANAASAVWDAVLTRNVLMHAASPTRQAAGMMRGSPLRVHVTSSAHTSPEHGPVTPSPYTVSRIARVAIHTHMSSPRMVKYLAAAEPHAHTMSGLRMVTSLSSMPTTHIEDDDGEQAPTTHGSAERASDEEDIHPIEI